MPYVSLAQQGFFDPFIASGSALRGDVQEGTGLYNEYKPGGLEDQRRQQMLIDKQNADNARMLAQSTVAGQTATTAGQNIQNKANQFAYNQSQQPIALNAFGSDAGTSGQYLTDQPMGQNGTTTPRQPHQPNTGGDFGDVTATPQSATAGTPDDGSGAAPKAGKAVSGVQDEGQVGSPPSPAPPPVATNTPPPGQDNSAPFPLVSMSGGRPVSSPQQAMTPPPAGAFASLSPQDQDAYRAQHPTLNEEQLNAAYGPTGQNPLVQGASFGAAVDQANQHQGAEPTPPVSEQFPFMAPRAGEVPPPAPQRLMQWGELNNDQRTQLVQQANQMLSSKGLPAVSPVDVAQYWDQKVVPGYTGVVGLQRTPASPEALQQLSLWGISPAQVYDPRTNTLDMLKAAQMLHDEGISGIGGSGGQDIHADPRDPNSPVVSRIVRLFNPSTGKIENQSIAIPEADQKVIAGMPKAQVDLLNSTANEYLGHEINKTFVSQIAPKMHAIENMEPNIDSNNFKDMDLLNSYAGITRPGSVVRDSTIETDLENAGMTNALARHVSSAMGRGGLSAQDRKQIADAARKSYDGYKTQAAADLQQGVERMSTQTGLPVEKLGPFMYGGLWNTLSGVDKSRGAAQTPGGSGILVDKTTGKRWRQSPNGGYVPAD